MLRILSLFVLLIVYSQIGYTQCNTITTNQSLVFSNQWTEYLQHANSNNIYQGQKTSNLVINRQFYYTLSNDINVGGKIINIPAQGYKVSKDCFLPLSVGDINNIHTLKKTFPKGFYTIKLMLQGATMSNILFLYGNGSVSNNISLSTALNYTSSSSINGLNNKLYLSKTHESDVLEQVIYLDGETNILLYVKGKLEAFAPNMANDPDPSFKPFNSFQCSIIPLSAPQQLCANYTAIVDNKNSFCNLGAVSMEVLDENSKYLFFYKDNTNAFYKIHSDILTPNNNRQIYINNISFTGSNIPEWGVIRMVDGCTFYEPSKPIQFPNQNFQINNVTIIQPTQCGLSYGGIKISLTPTVIGGVVKDGVYEIILQGQMEGNTTYLRFTTEININKGVNGNVISNELILNDIPLNFSISKIQVLNTDTNCNTEINQNYSFQSLSSPNISINSETICDTKLTLIGTDDYPCGKIVWYEDGKEISTSKSINVNPTTTTTYTAKFFLDGKVFTTPPQSVNSKLIPTIDYIQFSANPYISNLGTSLNIKPITNVDITSSNCQCSYTIKNNATNTTITIPKCELDISPSGISPGTYNVTLDIVYNNTCKVSTSKLLEVINPFSVANQTTSHIVNVSNVYATTKSLLDEAYFIKKQESTTSNDPNHINNFVTFQYNQQYEPFNLGKMMAKLYNWKREIVAYSEIQRVYGVQWYSMPIPNVKNISGSYILELTDDNGWFQKIRVKNIALNPTCGTLKPESGEYCTITNNGFKLYDIKNGQAPYQVKWTLSNTDNTILEEKILTTQTNFSVYVPSIILNNNTNYKLKVNVIDACGTSICVRDKEFQAKACSSPINERTTQEEEIPKFEFRINVLPQTPINPNVPIIKN